MVVEAAKTELIAKETVEQISTLQVQLDADSIAGFVGTRFREHYQKAIAAEVAREKEAREKESQADDEAQQLVQKDAEDKTKSKRSAMHKALEAWGYQADEHIEVQLTATGLDEKTQKKKYGTYTCDVTFYRKNGKKHTSYGHPDGFQFSLRQVLKYPAKVVKLLEERDQAAQDAAEAHQHWLQLKQEESVSMTECRQHVQAYLVAQRIRNLADGDRMLTQLEEVADAVAAKIGERHAAQKALPKTRRK